MRYWSASSNTRSSRLAEPGSNSKISPAGILVSYTVISSATVRASIWLEVS
ncbi:Uncharacterised protein [Mycobacteroides abscessus subsp. abscessus]|nr:Uncharacterised protein [Mycobacteroides abscessus subsp. abscessus]